MLPARLLSLPVPAHHIPRNCITHPLCPYAKNLLRTRKILIPDCLTILHSISAFFQQAILLQPPSVRQNYADCIDQIAV